MEQFFYSNKIYTDKILIPIDEARHILKVLRKHNGDDIQVVDGLGNLYHARIISDSINHCKAKIISIEEKYQCPDYYIHIAISPPKSHDRLESFIEKAVEIGVQEISFIVTNHSERNIIKKNRINKCAISAMKQSLKAYYPIINDTIMMSEFIKKCKSIEKYIAYLSKDNNTHLFNTAFKDNNYCILIGPEGDFSQMEINQSKKYGFIPVSLGNNRLRTETAAIVACNIFNIINNI
tara:strand:- start:495 stop:1202 length:708 start_codon:yes stop_codon:yes gene_type:complete